MTETLRDNVTSSTLLESSKIDYIILHETPNPPLSDDALKYSAPSAKWRCGRLGSNAREGCALLSDGCSRSDKLDDARTGRCRHKRRQTLTHKQTRRQSKCSITGTHVCTQRNNHFTNAHWKKSHTYGYVVFLLSVSLSSSSLLKSLLNISGTRNELQNVCGSPHVFAVMVHWGELKKKISKTHWIINFGLCCTLPSPASSLLHM